MSRITHDTDFNKIQFIFRDEWFLNVLAEMKSYFVGFGCSIPDGGFKAYKEYLDWQDRYWRRRSEIGQNEEYKNARLEITGGKERISSEEYQRLESLDSRLLPRPYGEFFSEILEHYGINKKEKYFRDAIEFYIFLGIRELPKSNLNLKWIHHKDGTYDLCIQIYGRTKKEDVLKNWKWITMHQKKMPDYIGKDKTWETMDRDMEIYQLYKKLKEKNAGKRQTSVSSVDIQIYAKLHSKYPELTTDNIRAFISKTKKRLDEK
jgi:uncharacterized protein (DUF433 family)